METNEILFIVYLAFSNVICPLSAYVYFVYTDLIDDDEFWLVFSTMSLFVGFVLLPIVICGYFLQKFHNYIKALGIKRRKIKKLKEDLYCTRHVVADTYLLFGNKYDYTILLDKISEMEEELKKLQQ